VTYSSKVVATVSVTAHRIAAQTVVGIGGVSTAFFSNLSDFAGWALNAFLTEAEAVVC
jgi:hypothetical protein